MKEAHIIEIPADQQKLISAAMHHHPLAEISQSPGHFLLLKLWQREEDLSGRRTARKESRMDSIRRELFNLCCFFFIFHGLFFTILFTSSSGDHQCKKWWIPSIISLCTSLVFVFLVQTKLYRYWKMEDQLQRERAEARTLNRCVQESRTKGASFDLSKDPFHGGKRMKSSSVEIKWRPLTWCSQYRVTVFLVCFTGLAFPACRFILCA